MLGQRDWSLMNANLIVSEYCRPSAVTPASAAVADPTLAYADLN